MHSRISPFLFPALLAGALAGWPAQGRAHGGVVADEDLCIIEIGVFRAHFTIYQPETRASEEFCEDVPDAARTVFVMDYLHDSLRRVPVDFRVIRDVVGRTVYASWDDVRVIDDLEAVTVFYQPPSVSPDASFTVEHEFAERGWYIGIVTTRHPTLDRRYQAVFGFHVGGRGWGYWPWLLLLLAAVQLHYWISSGGPARLRARRSGKARRDG
ncbi:MAG: hypothetical protein GWM87_09640 [Xanthomonadales bacterium]|nr:hypothetical protein [Xanthomonadales bacterium]NIX13164.1 hypothetical protein [Xanthomonadales bacterium]